MNNLPLSAEVTYSYGFAHYVISHAHVSYPGIEYYYSVNPEYIGLKLGIEI
ncbi:MAG: hypothetical protein ACI8SE_000751 [Bacteroidia bacterium]|jgi:hypothetical protein